MKIFLIGLYVIHLFGELSSTALFLPKKEECKECKVILPSPKSKQILDNNLSLVQESSEEINSSSLLLDKVSFFNVVVSGNLDIFELSLKYYGAYEAYSFIYLANKELLKGNLTLKKGMLLRLPINKNFKEEPLLIETN